MLQIQSKSMNKKQAEKIQAKFIKGLLSNNLRLDEMKLICSLNTQLDIEVEALPAEKWNVWTIEAIGCLKPSSEKIHLALIDLNRNQYELEAGVAALGKINPQSEQVQLKLVSLLLPEVELATRIHWSVVDTLSQIDLKNKTYPLLINMFVNGNENTQRAVNYVFCNKAPKLKNLKKININCL